MARTAHCCAERHDRVPMTVPAPRFEGMDWPGDEGCAYVPAALLPRRSRWSGQLAAAAIMAAAPRLEPVSSRTTDSLSPRGTAGAAHAVTAPAMTLETDDARR